MCLCCVHGVFDANLWINGIVLRLYIYVKSEDDEPDLLRDHSHTFRKLNQLKQLIENRPVQMLIIRKRVYRLDSLL